MKINFLLGLVAVATVMTASSCGDDDPPPPAGITFEVAESTVNESNGTISSFHPLLFNGATGVEVQIKVVSDKPLLENAVIALQVSGTAKKNSSSNPVGDYEFVTSSENITIEKGASSATIRIKIFEDYEFEIDDDDNLFETIIIRLLSVISGPAQIGVQDTHTLNIMEDDMVVVLNWDAGGGNRGDVDMDLLLSLDNDIIWGSANEGNALEAMNIPAGFPAGTYGLSYTYYSGTSDDLVFASLMFSTAGTLNGNSYVFLVDDPLMFTANYTLQNINVWDDPSHPNHTGDPQVVQTMVKNGINYTNISSITPPAVGSRVGSWPELKKLHPDIVQRLRTPDQSRFKK